MSSQKKLLLLPHCVSQQTHLRITAFPWCAEQFFIYIAVAARSTLRKYYHSTLNNCKHHLKKAVQLFVCHLSVSSFDDSEKDLVSVGLHVNMPREQGTLFYHRDAYVSELCFVNGFDA